MTKLNGKDLVITKDGVPVEDFSFSPVSVPIIEDITDGLRVYTVKAKSSDPEFTQMMQLFLIRGQDIYFRNEKGDTLRMTISKKYLKTIKKHLKSGYKHGSWVECRFSYE